MGKSLLIVESPGKIKTISRFVGKEYVVRASVGHCYTIEHSDSAIDIENNYKPKYVLISGKKKIVDELKSLSEKCDTVYIATDDDREGEAIGYHIANRAIKDKSKIKRIKFIEITKSAITKALANPTVIDEKLFNSQQARSVLDMLVGFKVSPVLWKKVCSGTSAGRVQSIGLRLIVDRQEQIDSFKPEEYWTIMGLFKTDDNNKLWTSYNYKGKIPNNKLVNRLVNSINKEKDWKIKSIDEHIRKRSPAPLFNTSSMQQFCSSQFGWDGKRTMKVAQNLYEGYSINGGSVGLITYHRTDSLNISNEALTAVRSFILKKFGKDYVPDYKRKFKSKNKSAQEAHEGIRPTHLEIHIKDIEVSIPADEFKLYSAIYKRFIACQMTDAEFYQTKIVVGSGDHTFSANGNILKFDGFLKLWDYSETKEEILPKVKINQKLILEELKPEQHFTKPPPAYNTALLVKKLEEDSIGRPSTYATITDTLLRREYVEKDGKNFKPTDLGKKISGFLVENFPELMDTKYTARIEYQLDEIADGKEVWYEVVDGFFKELKNRIVEAKGVDSIKESEDTDILCPNCKKFNLAKRTGRYGYFYSCKGYFEKGKDKCNSTFRIAEDGSPILKKLDWIKGKKCDKCGGKIVIRKSKKTGKEFGGCANFPRCRGIFDLEGNPIEFQRRK